MIALHETGTLERELLGVFEDREHALAEVASAEPTARLATWTSADDVVYEWIAFDTAHGTEHMYNISEVELNQFRG